MMNIRRILLLALLALCTAVSVQAQDYVNTPVTVSREKVKYGDKFYLSHVVLERQTLFSIAKAYGVDIEDIYEANPTLRETGLQKNAIILIPFTEGQAGAAEATASTPDQQEITYREHTVKWYEDIDDIAKMYGISVKDIMEFNGLKSRKVTRRQVLRIPSRPLHPGEETAAAQEPEQPQEPEKKSTLEELWDSITGKSTVDVALVLPLNAGGTVSEVNMDFYSGVLLALRDLQASGIRTNLNVYDLTAGTPSRDQLTSCDFVLGPVASRELEAVLERVEGKVPVISPLDQRAASLAQTYGNFIQAPSAVENQYSTLAQWVKEDTASSDRVILITEKAAKNATPAVSIRGALMQNEVQYDLLTYAIVEGRGIPSILTQKASKGGVNRIVVASESEAFIGDVMRNISIMIGKGYKMVLYAPSRIRTFDTIDGNLFHQGNLHIASSYYVDYGDAAVKDFVLAYRALYKTEPSQFAFQGYDTARYFISMASRYGRRFPEALGRSRERGLHTDFLFTGEESGAKRNTAVRKVLYLNDFTTQLVK